MKSSEMAQPDALTRIPGTTLYKGIDTPSEAMAFLLWNTAAPPDSLTTDQTWADSGKPSDPGYYLFLNAVPPAGAAPAFESALRAQLAKPEGTGFVWALYQSPASATVQTVVPVKIAVANDKPVVADTVSVQLPPGMQTLGFGAESPVIASRVLGEINSFVMSYPPLPNSDPPSGVGIGVDIVSGRVGCLHFDGLVNARPVEKEADRALKVLVHVQIDPIRPFDPNRTYQIFTGATYFLESTEGGYRLTPAF
jgi:hypothetical protein